MASTQEAEQPMIKAVHIEGLAALKIVKHCQESLPTMVTGSLLGLTVGGILEITHAFPFPDSSRGKGGDIIKSPTEDDTTVRAASNEMDGHEYQLEMMKMLREVNVDNNCVGWYQSMYLGSYSTQTLVENQLSYQTDLSKNAVVILYDPVQTSHGRLTLKCFRLTKEAIQMKQQNRNDFIDPRHIFEEVPVKLTNPSLIQALLFDVGSGTYPTSPIGVGAGGDAINNDEDDGGQLTYGTSGVDCTFDNLDMSTNPYLEKHLEFLCNWVDDLASEQQKFQYYARNISRGSSGGPGDKHGKKRSDAQKEQDEKRVQDGWAASEAPRRMESLLITNQIRNYCDQVDKFAGGGFGKLFLASGLHKEAGAGGEAKTSSA